MCLAFLAADMAMLTIARVTGENLWVWSFTLPIEVSLVLWLLSTMQPDAVSTAVYRWLIPPLLLVPAILLVVVGPGLSLERRMAPFLSLTALIAALHTGIRLSLRTGRRLTSESSFWLCSGLSLFWLQYVAVDAFVDAVLLQHRDWALTAYEARAAITPIAFAMMAWAAWISREPRAPRARPRIDALAAPETGR